MSFRDWRERGETERKKVGPPRGYCVLAYSIERWKALVLVGYYWKLKRSGNRGRGMTVSSERDGRSERSDPSWMDRVGLSGISHCPSVSDA